MTKPSTWLSGGLALALALSAAGCGLATQSGPGMNAAKSGAFGARGAGFEAPTLLEDFSDDPSYRFDFHGPGYGHPFYQPINFSKQKAGGSAVLELVAPNSLKPRKGMYLRALDEEEGTFHYTIKEGDKDIDKLAARAKVSFAWANNATASSETSMSAMAVFVFQSKSLGTAALAYAWSNNLGAGRVINSQLRIDEENVPLRVLVIEKGNGLGEACSEAALNKMTLAKVERDFVADVRYAFAKSTPVSDPNAPAADDNGPKTFVPPAGGPNTDVDGLLAIGFGAEIPKGICSHAVLDDVAFSIKKTD